MKKVFHDGLKQWRSREENKLFHYTNIYKKNTLNDDERKIIKSRINKIEELIRNIDEAFEEDEAVENLE